MTRSAIVWDRLVTFLFGVVLIGLGVGAVGWNAFWRNRFPASIDASALTDATRQSWWPWAAAGVGVVLVLLGLRWLASHSPAAKAGTVPLSSSGDSGRMTADLGAIAAAAAQRLEAEPSIHSAKAKAISDRGRPTLDVTVTAASVEDLAAAAAAADQVACDAITMIGDASVAARTRIRIDGKNHGSRVR